MTVGWSPGLIQTCAEAMSTANKQLLFDLSKVDWIAPFGLTTLSATILACLRGGKSCSWDPPTQLPCREYLTRIGFDQLFLPNGAAALQKSTSVELKNLHDIDAGYVEALTDVLCGKIRLTEDQRSQLFMHLIELMQNAKDHARSRMGYFVCAQSYPTRGTVRISFVDVGRGIPTLLRTLERYEGVKDDAKLIEEATEAGVTTRKRRPGGMGLTFIRQYLRESQGTLSIVSERGKVTFQPKKIIRRTNRAGERPFPGTAIDILMRAGD